ncbi:AAA family ATPase [Marinobacter salinexigens]|uniref:AAA family ATPase n=1 Tax=Marinobacter salinexigens TaxID=2919747 RepID=A0A5B0VK49_9GAMM|nr:ATP-binding protein [Marinobacter salinexigens]KAA1174693.1 AAA family ATPase [Marinobacter salinexigens]
MIKKLYVNNFRSLVNFELSPGPLSLIMGPNGSGKSAVFDLLDSLRRFVADGERLDSAFSIDDKSQLPSLPNSEEMHLELELATDEGVYFYSLTIEYSELEKKQRVQKESLEFNGKPLFKSTLGEAQLYRDDHSEGPNFPMDWNQSGVGFLMARKDNQRLTRFKERIQRIWVVRLNPFNMADESRQESTRPTKDMSNLVDWYRYLVQSRFEAVQESTDDLQDRISGFRSLSAVEKGEARVFRAIFEGKQSFLFSKLSEGQRALIALYTLIYGVAEEAGATLCIDEPENFLALPEIQPWLDGLYDLVEDQRLQAMLISHHPRMVNFLAAGHGVWLERNNQSGPTRVKIIGPAESDAPIKVDELISRGWIGTNA